MANFSVKVDLTGALAQLDNIESKALAAVRPAAQAGAQVFYDEVKLNVGRIKPKTGNLAASIYQAYSKDNSNETLSTYHISWNARKAPHGHLVEFGHFQRFKQYVGSDGKWYTTKIPIAPRQVGARPFIRPAFDTKRLAALQAVESRWLAEVDKTL
jgi:hypothetical protein